MVNKVLKVGDSAAVTIPRRVLKEMGIGVGDKVTVTFHPKKNELVIQPLPAAGQVVSDRVARLTAQFMDRYRKALEQLAS